ncbi:hypothetical protein [Streptomyces sp. MJM1172]|uniref:hypothetical protein n=1 Tax=Streptomyces sp. MJM1172 TaxID=1703926 RepID=UPI00093CAA37|nr:hypothetical protein [Streptomyces sp. MJM1172]OKI52633.1 hypothetical protein AMK15_29920 [Streptomyces sp. MJM1172]
MTRSAQRAARWTRSTLLAALLLGIVTMHTLGHPSESHAMEDVTGARTVAQEHPLPAHRAPAAHQAPAAHRAPAHQAPAAHAVAPAPGGGPAVHAPPGSAMDPMSVCLAVLAGLVLLALGRAVVRYDGGRATGGRLPGRVPAGPDPPGPRELLRRLAVLRV